MEINTELAGIWIFILFSLQSLGESSLSIEPSRPLYVMEHGKLKLDCTHKGNDGHIVWTKNGVPLSESDFTMNTFRTAAMDDESGTLKLITTITVYKSELRVGDSGRYACETGTQSEAIRVKVLKVVTGSHVITDPGGIISLQCDPDTYDVIVLWTKNLTPLTQLTDLSGRFTLESRNTTLKIENASLADSGRYECHIQPRDGVIQGNLSTHVVLSGIPYFPDGQNVTEIVTSSRQRLELHCPARGYPIPRVMWMSDGERVNSSGGIQLLSEHGVSCAVLRIEEYIPEYGESFSCEAFNKEGRTRRSFQIMFVNSAQVFQSIPAIFIITIFVTISNYHSRFQS